MKIIIAVLLSIMNTNYCLPKNQLIIPDTLSGSEIYLTIDNGKHQFKSGPITNTMGVNGNILGPTIFLNNGSEYKFNVKNNLSDTTTIHWHGLHVAPENDGGPHTFILPNTTWKPRFTVMDKASTYWYHPHLHSKTNEHVSKGIAGFIIVKDEEESKLNLPRTYGIDDIPVVIQTKDFDLTNQVVTNSNSDDVVMANATINAFIDLPAQIIRLRLLNGASQRSFYLGLNNNQPIYQISSDGGLLEDVIKLNRLILSPGERAEILIDLIGLEGESIQLISFASELPNGIYGAKYPGMAPPMSLNGYNPNPLNGNDFIVLEINVKELNSNPITSIPSQLVQYSSLNPSNSNTTRSITFSPASMGMNQLNGKFFINNSTFNMNTIDFNIPLNNIEIWELRNQTAIAHPFHIHDVQFNILTRGGASPPANERGRKDVVLVRPQEVVRLIAKFEDFSNPYVPYMYHCHLLTHEDNGMMGQFIVSNTQSKVDVASITGDDNFTYNYKNDALTLMFNNTPASILITDYLGRTFIERSTIINNYFRFEGVRNGLYTLIFKFKDRTTTRKIYLSN